MISVVNQKMKNIIWTSLVTAAFLLLSSCSRSKQIHTVSGQTMGTYYRVKIVKHLSPKKLKAVKRGIELKLKQVNDLMSTYIPNSQISLFNKHQKKSAFSIHESFYYVLIEAQKIAKKSKGAFDVTIGPLVNLWGFGPKGIGQKPSKLKVTDTLKSVGYKKLIIEENNRIKKTHPKLQIDLSAIAKGYGVDAVLDVLNRDMGLKDALVEIGGEVRTSGTINDLPWKIGIEGPGKNLGDKIQKVIMLKDMAVATSGSYRNFYKRKGKVFSHTISTKTGRPVEHLVVSVSVIDKNCLLADGWATALMASGEVKGLKTANAQNLLAYFLIKGEKEGEVLEVYSEKMIEFLKIHEVH
jgi:thiamine biosynthesis lipoprotein